MSIISHVTSAKCMLQTTRFPFLLLPDRAAEYCDDRVCVCVCVCVCLSANISPELHVLTDFMHVTYDRGSVLLWRRRDTLCTSGFVDDVVLAHRPRQLNVAAQLIEAALDLAINGA